MDDAAVAAHLWAWFHDHVCVRDHRSRRNLPMAALSWFLVETRAMSP
jgi:hypothetical protein